jgi:hypothetical protein
VSPGSTPPPPLAGPIPRRLHQVWLGPRPVPDRWASRWRRRHPRWAYRLWREADIEPILPIELRPAWQHFLGKGNWHGAADIARLAILQREGGVYMDIDSEPVRALDRAPFMRGTFFGGLELGTPEQPIHLTNGAIGSIPGHPILAAYVELIARAETIEPAWRTVGGGFLTEAVLAHRDLPGVFVLPVRTFYPEDKNGVSAPGRDPVYARQYWASTHRLYDFEGDSWRRLAKRRRHEPMDEPLSVRAQRGLLRVFPLELRRSARRAFRRVVPVQLRRAGRAVIRGVSRRIGPRGGAPGPATRERSQR